MKSEILTNASIKQAHDEAIKELNAAIDCIRLLSDQAKADIEEIRNRVSLTSPPETIPDGRNLSAIAESVREYRHVYMECKRLEALSQGPYVMTIYQDEYVTATAFRILHTEEIDIDSIDSADLFLRGRYPDGPFARWLRNGGPSRVYNVEKITGNGNRLDAVTLVCKANNEQVKF